MHRNVNRVEIEDISNGDDLHSVMVQQVRTRRQRGEEALFGQSSQLGLNSYSKDVSPEQPKLVEQTSLEQPKSNAPIKEPVPNSIDIIHPIQLEPVADTPEVPKAQLVGAGSSSVFNTIQINPVIDKEYLPFTLPMKDDVNPVGEMLNKPHEPLPGGSTRVDQIPKDFGNGVPLQMEKKRYVKGKSLPKGKRSKPIGIMQGVTPYDLLEDLGKVKADITIKQLLGIAPSCRSLLQSTLVTYSK